MNSEPFDVLQKVTVNVVDKGPCGGKFKQIASGKIILPEETFCTYAYRKGTCKGDSGGPIQIAHNNLHCMYTQIGIISYGINCYHDSPEIHTKVSNHIGWIEDIVWPT
ncbi:chymotrypsin-2-like [Halyomorpha halys]|uniref:chymotrypsin-2-like n=1 Tax=Halyomorpha halys TaxID=286706 RepID=UPI0006D4C984|nr:serine protease persephone-like [Halyomorpha halys]